MVDSFSSHSSLENVRFYMNRKHVKRKGNRIYDKWYKELWWFICEVLKDEN